MSMVYFRGWVDATEGEGEGEGDMRWYYFDVSEGKIDDRFQDYAKDKTKRMIQAASRVELKRPREGLGYPTTPSDVSYGVPIQSNCAALGRYIFCAGGYQVDNGTPLGFRLLRDVHLVDTLSSHNIDSSVKKSLPPMKIGRSYPNMAAVNGKVFVMGGTLEHTTGLDRDTWGEFFDLSTQRWEYMPPLPDEHQGGRMVTAVIYDEQTDKKMIVLCSAGAPGGVLSFDVEAWSWGYSRDPGLSTFTEKVPDFRPAVSGATMYWFSRNLYVFAYDLSDHRWLSSKWLEEFTEQGDISDQSRIPALVHITGDDFCLVWVDERCLRDTELMQIRCTKLTISKCVDEKECEASLTVLVQSTQTYLVDAALTFKDALMVDWKNGMEYGFCGFPSKRMGEGTGRME